MQVQILDHVVLTVENIEATCAWYTQVLGMEQRSFGADRTALHFGQHKLNLHLRDTEAEPKAARPAPGTADLCFIVDGSIEQVVDHLYNSGVAVIQGPVDRTGARGPIRSVYVYDPDRNLIEIAVYTL